MKTVELQAPRLLPAENLPSPGRGIRADRDLLDPPAPAFERRRPGFHPATGWFRSLERHVSLWVSRAVFPRIPGMALPYSSRLRRTLSVSSADIRLRDLPASFEGLRVLLITDVHAGPFLSLDVLAETFTRLLESGPDVVLLGGDLITARTVEFDEQREAFALLRAPLGVHAVLGNHDHYSGEPERIAREVESLGITVLHNRSIELRRGGESLSLAGIDDLLIGAPDLDRALEGTRGPVVLLSHNPDALFAAARRGVALVLSGHTHAGQVRIPGLPVIVRQSKYRLDEGRYRIGETELVVSRGLGAVGVPFRMACPPEAVLLTLRAG